jgi:diphthamide biosynthesis protein 3
VRHSSERFVDNDQGMETETDVYDEVEIEDMNYEEDAQRYTYNCPCGDLFVLTVAEMRRGEQIAKCPSCSLRIRVIYDVEAWCPSRAVPVCAPAATRV